MSNNNRKSHWENVYRSSAADEVSWYQSVPQTSLDFVKEVNLPKNAKIIDIGGGESLFVDHLLDLGFQDVTVLDISETAIERAKNRLGNKSNRVKWIVADASHFQPTEQYEFWHDRATFHFLTNEEEITNYLEIAHESIPPQGSLIIGTFSEQGPNQCSGIGIKQYSENSMKERLKNYFTQEKCLTIDHETPTGTIQNFVFCRFKKK